MIDFLNLSEIKRSWECLKLGYSMQLLPYQYDPYVFFTDGLGYISDIKIIDIYGNETNLPFEWLNDGYFSIKNIQFNDANIIILKITKDVFGDIKTLYSDP